MVKLFEVVNFEDLAQLEIQVRNHLLSGQPPWHSAFFCRSSEHFEGGVVQRSQENTDVIAS
jgi:hypothetical protein